MGVLRYIQVDSISQPAGRLPVVYNSMPEQQKCPSARCERSVMMFRRCRPFMALILSACATEPSSLSGGPFANFTPQQTLTRDAVGSLVRWGGTILSVTPGKNETCFQVLGRPLDSSSRP